MNMTIPQTPELTGRDRVHWRAVLEARWRTRLEELTELLLAYHREAADTPGGLGAGPEARRMLHRAVAARQRLADVEEALGRLAAGTFGRCELCASAIESGTLSVTPQARYCAECATATGH
jgi:DnaK suppressor protein